MNKEQAKKHGKVIRWFLSNPEKGVWYKKQIGNEWELSYNPSFGAYAPYVQNDEYAELRKAQADGKVIQYKGSCDHKFRDCYKDACFSEKSEYRIKPDEPEFKVGDWVYNTFTKQVECVNKVSISKDMTLYVNGVNASDDYFKLWKPKEGKYVCQKVKDEHFRIIRYCDETMFSATDIYPLEFAMTLKDKQ